MKIKNIISTLLIVIITIVLLNICYSKFILKDDLIKIFGKSFLVVMSGSMEPDIKAGELIIINQEKNYNVGDIVTYLDEENYLITHRIVEIDSKNFIAKGDANNLKDEINKITNIEGKVIFHSKILGFCIIFTKTFCDSIYFFICLYKFYYI